MTHHSWRAALAVPAVVSLAFGGALLAAGPALAAPAESSTVDTVATAPSTDAATTTTNTTTTPSVDSGSTSGATASEAAAETAAPTPTSTGEATPAAADPAATAPASDSATTGSSSADSSATGSSAAATTAPAAPATTAAPAPTATDSSTAAATPTPTSSTASTFAVTTPVDGVPSTTTTPSFSGTGEAGSTVVIEYLGADGDVHTAATTTVDTDSTWTATTSFADMGPGVTKVVLTVAEVDAQGDPITGATPVVRQLSFTKPPVQARGRSIVLTPDYPTIDGAAVSGIGLAATGFTAGEPLVIAITGPDGKSTAATGSEATPTADADGAFSELIALPADAVGGDYVVTVTGTVSTLVLTKTAYVLGDPTITSPTAGEKIVGTKVTFTGTGTPGSSIGLVIAPTSAVKAAAAAAASAAAADPATTAKAPAATSGSSAASAADPAAGSDASQNIAVGASGSWSVTVTLPKPGDYTAVAIAGVVDANGDPISDNTGLPVLSGPSAEVEFVLAAPPVITTSATGPTLAYTGSNASPFVIGGALAVLLGAGLMVATRRRRDEIVE